MKTLKLIKIFALIPAIFVLCGLIEMERSMADDAKKKFESSDYLPTLSIRDSTGMYTYLPPRGEGILQIFYLKYPLDFVIKFDLQNESRMVNSKGDLLEVVITTKTNTRSFFFIKGELIDVTKSGCTDKYFRVKLYNENEYIFRFGEENDYKYKIFLRSKMSFIN